jgi:hypothetical protein
MGGKCSTLGDIREMYTALFGKSEGNNSLEDLGVDGMIILNWILNENGWEDVD